MLSRRIQFGLAALTWSTSWLWTSVSGSTSAPRLLISRNHLERNEDLSSILQTFLIMTKRYTVLVIGMGKRGLHHATFFKANPRFELIGISSRDPARLKSALSKLGEVPSGSDASALALSAKPDIFCFCTPPNVRLDMLKLGIECGAKLIAFEKPVALTSAELFAMRDLIRKAGVKGVVSHQHRYGVHYRKVKEIVASGGLGRVHTVYGTATGWMTHMLSHLIDYTCWFNNDAPATWVMAQAAGRAKFTDSHPSPDYIGGFVQFAK